MEKEEGSVLMEPSFTEWSFYQKGGMVDVAIHELGAEVIEVEVLEIEDDEITS